MIRRVVFGLLLVGIVVAASPGRGQVPGSETRVREEDGVRVLHAPEDSLLARQVLEDLLGLSPLPGVPRGRPRDVEVVLAPDPEAFAEASGGRPPHWSAAVAVLPANRIVLQAWPGSEILGPRRVALLRHEWAHLGMNQASGGRRAPRWFSEGYAEWAGGWDRSRAWRLRVLLALGKAPPLDSLSLAWPAERAPAESAYLLSASVVEYLQEHSDGRGLEVLFDRWRETGSFEEGFRRTFGLTTSQLEEDWRAWARDRYGWLFVLTHSGLAWGVLALLLVGLVSFRRRHARDQMARLRARELPEEPAFWRPEAGDGPSGTGPEENASPGGIDTKDGHADGR